MTAPILGSLLHAFFEDYLKVQKGLRLASVRSYRDALRLFLCFVAKACHRNLSRLTLADLTADRVLEFLHSLETDRHNCVATRNHRLTTLHTFFEYLASRNPEGLAEAQRVAAIPLKRTPPPQTHFLERDEIATLFTCLPSKGRLALRDRTLLLFLYNTGARVQEVVDLCVEHLDLEPPPRVHLCGKGGKWRVCLLWSETASLLAQLLAERAKLLSPTSPVFVSSQGRPLTRFGIYKLVRRHAGVLTTGSRPPSQWLSPHVFRHTTAVHLLEAGVEVNVIRGWLGHVHLGTTNRYAEINVQVKEEALRACQPPTGASEGLPRRPIWRDDETLLKWLESL